MSHAEKSLKESEELSSGEIIPSRNMGTDPGKVRIGRALKQRNLQGEESTVRIRRRESRNPADPWILEKLREV
jgi:hypothetical protein